jgi:uncharacterized damage-inducible protein DinB
MSQSIEVSEVERIVDQLDREHSGDPWHGSSLKEILRGVAHTQASAKPLPGAHSIWEVVLHVTSWKNEVRKRLSGAPASVPEDGDWPAVGEPSPARWAETLSRLEAAHRNLVDAVRAMPEDKLARTTNDQRDAAIGSGVSYYVLLHGVAQHDAYHAGQIALLKKGVPSS